MMRARLSDERGIVVGFVVKLVIVIAVVGLAVVEGGSILFARLRAQDVAETAASVAAGSFLQSRDEEAARAAAELAISDKDSKVRLRRFVVRPDGSVEVTVRKRASTILVQHIGFLEELAVAKATAVGRPPPV